MDRYTEKSIDMLRRKGLSNRDIERELEKSGKKNEAQEVTRNGKG